ncbi:hypothetical protein Tco_0709034 [Tanacetum coccineum]
MPEGVLVLSGFSRVWKSLTRDPILRDSSGNVMGIHNFYVCLNGLDRRSRRKFTMTQGPLFRGFLSIVLLQLPVMPQFHSSRGSALTSLFDDNQSDDEESEVDDNDDACYEIPIITPIRSVATIPTGDPTGDAIDNDFFLFAPGPYYATYLEDGVVVGSYEVSCEKRDGLHHPTLTILTKEMFKDPHVCKIVVDQFPTPREMVWIKAFPDDRLAEKMSVLYYLMMSHRGELLA